MMMNKMLIVGTGSIGRRHTENFGKHKIDIDIVDIRDDRIAEARSKLKINKSFNDYNEAIEKNKYDAVIITAPPNLHLPIAKKAIEYNNNIFIEKPLGMDIKGWSEVSKTCSEKRLLNYVAYCHRHINYTTKFKSVIKNNKIGKIFNIIIRWGSYLPDWHPWEDYRSFYMAKKEQGGGALLDESHGIDLLRYIFGEVSEVFAVVDKISNLEITADDHALLTLKLKNDALAQISFDLNARYTFCKIEATGENGTAIWDRVDHSIKIFDSNEKKWSEEQFTKDDFLEMYPNQTKHYLECLKNKTTPLIDINDALKTQLIIDKCFESSSKKKMVKIEN